MGQNNRRDPIQVAEAIRKARTIAICCHINPDGDAIGSSLAIMRGLKKLGKQAEVYCQDKVPDNLMFLPGAQDILNAGQAAGKQYDLLLCVDTATFDRTGACGCLKEQSTHIAQVDHHGTNPGYAEFNDVDGHASANCLLIHELLNVLGVKTDREIAMCLYAGISTDTGNFSFSNTTPEAFSVMSELMKAGLPLQELNRILFCERAKEQVLLTGKAIGGMRFLNDGKLTVMTLTRKDFEECGALPEHADTLVNVGLDTIGTKMALLARESADGKIKFSLRCLPPYTVDGIASSFGGGGHAQAAGITMQGTLEDTVNRVAGAMSAALNGMKQ